MTQTNRTLPAAQRVLIATIAQGATTTLAIVTHGSGQEAMVCDRLLIGVLMKRVKK